MFPGKRLVILLKTTGRFVENAQAFFYEFHLVLIWGGLLFR